MWRSSFTILAPVDYTTIIKSKLLGHNVRFFRLIIFFVRSLSFSRVTCSLSPIDVAHITHRTHLLGLRYGMGQYRASSRGQAGVDRPAELCQFIKYMWPNARSKKVKSNAEKPHIKTPLQVTIAATMEFSFSLD